MLNMGSAVPIVSLAAEAAGRLAAMNQHPISEVFWRGTERLWRERLANFNKARRRS